ncbi:hypothetical protein ABZT47_01975 [Sphaerisporangium sp. NPDC005289]|uniref:hypothetical protein n=1 Tax=Sphaerisporangium sp. NPDC005289 TaxID=3155247 RepID=UPI0033A9A948
MLAATLLAAAVGVFGLVVCALALAVASSGSAADPWLNAGTVTAGSVLVQIVGQLVGTGLGLLVRSPVIACLATLAPMGLWWALGAVDFLRPAQAFTPYATLRSLLSGHMNPLTWTVGRGPADLGRGPERPRRGPAEAESAADTASGIRLSPRNALLELTRADATGPTTRNTPQPA